MTTPTTTPPDSQSLQSRLEAPMDFGWKPKSKPYFNRATGRNECLGVPFITSSAARRRLDEVFGPLGWRSRHEVENESTAPGGTKTVFVCQCVCTVEVFSADANLAPADKWIPRTDVGFGRGDTPEDAKKGAYSDSFKRAAAAWGVGRFLDDIPRAYRPCNVGQNGGFESWMTEEPPPPPPAPLGPYWEAVMTKFPAFSAADFEPWLGPREEWAKETHAEKLRRLYALIFSPDEQPLTLQEAMERIEVEANEPTYDWHEVG